MTAGVDGNSDALSSVLGGQGKTIADEKAATHQAKQNYEEELEQLISELEVYELEEKRWHAEAQMEDFDWAGTLSKYDAEKTALAEEQQRVDDSERATWEANQLEALLNPSAVSRRLPERTIEERKAMLESRFSIAQRRHHQKVADIEALLSEVQEHLQLKILEKDLLHAQLQVSCRRPGARFRRKLARQTLKEYMRSKGLLVPDELQGNLSEGNRSEEESEESDNEEPASSTGNDDSRYRKFPRHGADEDGDFEPGVMVQVRGFLKPGINNKGILKTFDDFVGVWNIEMLSGEHLRKRPAEVLRHLSEDVLRRRGVVQSAMRSPQLPALVNPKLNGWYDFKPVYKWLWGRNVGESARDCPAGAEAMTLNGVQCIVFKGKTDPQSPVVLLIPGQCQNPATSLANRARGYAALAGHVIIPVGSPQTSRMIPSILDLLHGLPKELAERRLIIHGVHIGSVIAAHLGALLSLPVRNLQLPCCRALVLERPVASHTNLPGAARMLGTTTIPEAERLTLNWRLRMTVCPIILISGSDGQSGEVLGADPVGEVARMCPQEPTQLFIESPVALMAFGIDTLNSLLSNALDDALSMGEAQL